MSAIVTACSLRSLDDCVSAQPERAVRQLSEGLARSLLGSGGWLLLEPPYLCVNSTASNYTDQCSPVAPDASGCSETLAVEGRVRRRGKLVGASPWVFNPW